MATDCEPKVWFGKWKPVGLPCPSCGKDDAYFEKKIYIRACNGANVVLKTIRYCTRCGYSA